MSPKTAIISLALLSLILTVTLSSAADHNGCPGNSVPQVLKHYNIPAGLFPDYVQHFSCEPDDSDNNALRLKIQLQGSCKVTRNFGLKNVVECEPEISAIISHHQLTDVKGITVMLYFLNQPFGELMTVTAVKISKDLLWGKTLQFISAEGLNSPKFPIFFFPNKPPTCDRSGAAAFAYSDESAAAVVAKKDEDVPNWVYKYGRLLPFVAA